MICETLDLKKKGFNFLFFLIIACVNCVILSKYLLLFLPLYCIVLLVAAPFLRPPVVHTEVPLGKYNIIIIKLSNVNRAV